jgi:hemoglobin-like flavoprotein
MDVCVKVGKELASDLYQELFVILCEKDNTWIEDKYNSGYWEGYIIRIIFNQYYGKYTHFAKNFINPIGTVSLNNLNVEVEEYQINGDLMLLSVQEVIANHDWYHTKIWQLYTKGDQSLNIAPFNARSINRGTGISRHEIWRVLKLIKEQANDIYNKKYAKHFD